MFLFSPNKPGGSLNRVSPTHYVKSETRTDAHVYLWGYFFGATAKFQISPIENSIVQDVMQWFDVPSPYGPIQLTQADGTRKFQAFFLNGLVGQCCRVIIESPAANTRVWAAIGG